MARKTAAQKKAEEEAKKLAGGLDLDTVDEEASTDEEAYDFEVGDVEILKPVALPLIITPKKGEKWKNKAQEDYARILNGYAYKNPTKFEEKKPVLLKNLKDLATKPGLLARITGSVATQGNLKFKDTRFGEVEGENTGAE